MVNSGSESDRESNSLTRGRRDKERGIASRKNAQWAYSCGFCPVECMIKKYEGHIKEQDSFA